MYFAPELIALGRIIAVIKMYRCQTADYRNPVTNKSMDTYLKQCLSIQDWAIWQRLQGSQPTGKNAVQRATA